jgi:hypothetical protein
MGFISDAYALNRSLSHIFMRATKDARGGFGQGFYSLSGLIFQRESDGIRRRTGRFMPDK